MGGPVILNIAKPLRHQLDDLEELVTPESLPTRELDQVLRLRYDCSSSRSRAGDGDTPTSPELEEALVTQDPKCTEHGVAVYADDGREIACRGESFTRACLAIGNRTAYLRSDLFEHGHARLLVEMDIKHSDSYSIIMSLSELRPASKVTEL